MNQIEFKSIGQEKQVIDIPEQPLMVLVHPPGTKVSMPGVLEISGIDTLLEMKTIKQNQWEHISTGPIFKELFFMCFKDDKAFEDYKLPKNIEDFRNEDDGALHVAGLIILTINAMLSGKHTKIFYRQIDSHLHPGTQQRVMPMMEKIQEWFGGNGGAQIATEEK